MSYWGAAFVWNTRMLTRFHVSYNKVPCATQVTATCHTTELHVSHK